MLVAAPLLVELTYFWGLAGTLQAVITPDLNVGFPHLVFFQYVVGHVGIVVAALFLVVGMGIVPRRRAVPRVYVITLGYTAFVGLVDALTGAQLHVPARPARRMDLVAAPRSVALVRRERRGRGVGPLHPARHALLELTSERHVRGSPPRARLSRRSSPAPVDGTGELDEDCSRRPGRWPGPLRLGR